MTATTSTTDSNDSESLDFLIAMMGGNIDRKAAQRVLAKFNGDVEKAADSLANGEAPPPESWDSSSLHSLHNFSDGYAPPPSSPAPKTKRLPASLPTIDLTMEDDTPQHHPEWAVVRSNTAIDPNSQITKDLDTQNDDIHRAIEASLAHADSVEEIEEELPPEDRVRKDNRPVVLRPGDHRYAHVGLLWQALFAVPQVRERIARYRGPMPSMTPDNTGLLEVEAPRDGPEGQVWSLVELFCYMELATLAELTGMPALSRFELSPWNNGILGSQNCDMLKDLAWTIETVLDDGIASLTPNWYRLFHCRYTMSDATEEEWDSHPINNNSDASVITVNYDDDEESNDLISCLSNQLLPKEEQEGTGAPLRGEVITHAADVLSFYPVRDEALPQYPATSSEKKNGERRKFRYPKTLYLDRFMQENERRVRERSSTDKDMLDEVERLESRKQKLTKYENSDVIKNLRASIYYYEKIAEAGESDIQRRAVIEKMAVKLKMILAKIEAEITSIDKEISSLRVRSGTLFDSPELQNYRYDLRAVLMHDGLYGRKHIYSYVQQDGIWWKTLDHSVTQVSEETVLNDKTGLHLSAGPYLLLYSLFIPEELRSKRRPWPDVIQEGARLDSENFLNELPPEIRAKVYNPMASQSPLTSDPHDEINETPGRMDTGV